MNDIDVLHRYGARRHYSPLERAVGDEAELTYYEFTFTTNPRRAPRNLRYLLRTAAGIGNQRTIVLGAEPYDMRVPLFRRFAALYPLVYHTSWPYWTEGNVPRRAYFSSQRRQWLDFLADVPVVAVTDRARQSLEQVGISGRWIPHAVDTETFTPKAGRSSGPTTVLFVGRLEPRKGVGDLLRMCRDGVGEGVQFRFVGDGPMRDELERLDAAGTVVYEGYVSEERKLAEIYASADVFVLPSRPADTWEELFGIVLIEAMACGLPAVSTNCVGPREIVDDGETGLIVDVGDYEALRNAVHRLVADGSLRNRMGRAGRARAERVYSMDVVAEQWREVLESAA